MLKEIFNVIKVFRPRHILKALLHPGVELEAFKYHYRRVSDHDFIKFFESTSKIDKTRSQTHTHDLQLLTSLTENLKRKLLPHHKEGYGGQMTKEAPVLYELVRIFEPSVIVETGVADGATSAYILKALEENQKGKLYSIDLPSDLLLPGQSPGWIVDNSLRHRWDLRIGRSRDLLGGLLVELKNVDMFLHDSLHTYENMLFEYRTVWPYIRPGGLFLSHDIGRHSAFFDFMKEAGIRWRDWRVFHVLGAFRVPTTKRQINSHV